MQLSAPQHRVGAPTLAEWLDENALGCDPLHVTALGELASFVELANVTQLAERGLAARRSGGQGLRLDRVKLGLGDRAVVE